MSGTFRNWLIPGVLTVVGGTALALAQTSAPIATDLKTRAQATLAAGDFGWTSIRIDGRDAVLAGTATTQAMIDDAIRRVASVHGVRAVSSEVVLAEYVSPFPFAARIEDGAAILTGGYPSESAHAAIIAELPGATDETRLLSGGPDASTFSSGARFGLAALQQFDTGEIRLADLSLTITGRAKSLEAFGDLQSLRDEVPPGIELAGLTITPPLASPYAWTATFDGERLAISGNAPDSELAARLRALAPAGVAVSTNLLPASGEPAGFAEDATALIRALLLLERGEAAIRDGVVTLSGAPATALAADDVTAVLAGIGGTATLEPPRVADFTLEIAKQGQDLTFTGFVPDAATRDRIAAIEGADASAVTLGRGAPERFASGLDFGLAVLAYIDQGSFRLRGDRLDISGRAGTVADFEAVTAMVAEGAPQGLSLVSAELHPPIASPFTFSAVKAPGGGTTLSGYVPDAAARSTLLAKIPDLAADGADPADGAPENFTFLAGKGLEVLALLDSGSLTFDGSDWSIDGVVDTPIKGFAADAAYSVAGLRSMGWTYTVRLPEAAPAASLPIISPYVWRAQKTLDGAISFTGFAPSDGFKRYLKVRAPEAADNTVLGAGAPGDFGTSAAAGLDALFALEEGSLGLSGSRWTLTGAVAEAGIRDTIQAALGAGIDAGNWQIAIQARDSAPVVTPYVWSATKNADGVVDLAGYLPNDELRTLSAARLGTMGNNGTSIASGEPTGFADDVLAGLDALAHLTSGKAAFDGSRWTLTGQAASQQEGEAALAALLGGSRNGTLWTTSIAGYTPPPPSSSEPPSSEPPVSSQEPQPSSSEPLSSEEPAASSEPASEEPAPSSSEPPLALESSQEPVASSSQPSVPEPSSSEPVPSSEPPTSSEPALPSEPPSSEPPAVEEPDERALEIVEPLPSTFVFEARRERGQPVVLSGGVPAAATAAYFGVIAGGVPTDAMLPQTGLPADFISSGIAGIDALMRLREGRLGFDGARWWLRGKAEQADARDAVSASIASLPNGATWSVFVEMIAPLDLCRDRVGELAGRNAIVFQSGSATLVADSLPVIDELAVDLALCPAASVHVEGHTDADGAEDLNLALSVARAETVVEALIERGVALERLYAEGYGESQPIASNETREGKARNRRIAFSISEE